MATIIASALTIADVQNAIDSATAGDIVTMPATSAIWGAGATYLEVNKDITLKGVGQGTTIVTISGSAPGTVDGLIRISAGGTVKSMTINGTSAQTTAAFSTSTTDYWRITDIAYNAAVIGDEYFVYAGNYGLIDHNVITGASASQEHILARGPTDSWQTAHSIGGALNLFIETNIFNGPGYVCDINANGRAVIRYNTFNGMNKVDGHGKATNTPARGVRHLEIYNNNWTNTESNFWDVIEFRGGGGRIFDNTIASTAWVSLTEYGCRAPYANFGSACQCPADYPIDDQIGEGIDGGAREPLYLWNNSYGGSTMVDGDLTWQSTEACASAGACATAFTLQDDIIVANRDYFLSEAKPSAMSSYQPYTYPHPDVGAIHVMILQ
jgi:hypothetical protein